MPNQRAEQARIRCKHIDAVFANGCVRSKYGYRVALLSTYHSLGSTSCAVHFSHRCFILSWSFQLFMCPKSLRMITQRWSFNHDQPMLITSDLDWLKPMVHWQLINSSNLSDISPKWCGAHGVSYIPLKISNHINHYCQQLLSTIIIVLSHWPWGVLIYCPANNIHQPYTSHWPASP